MDSKKLQFDHKVNQILPVALLNIPKTETTIGDHITHLH